ncbi:MAG: T9SS type A sorting domain-containing protein, partial [Bacteroidia bacterium]
DIFIAKYSSNGNLVWAKREGGKNNDIIYNSAINASGNFVITGGFAGSTTKIGTQVLTTSAQGGSILTVKYDTAGNVIWAKAEGSKSTQYGTCVTEDNSGNVYVAGKFYGYINLGTIILADTAPRKSVFLIKYNSSGNAVWAKSLGGNNLSNYGDLPQTMAVAKNGSIYLTGNIASDTVRFDSIIFTKTGASNIFNVEFDSSGKVIWADCSTNNGVINSAISSFFNLTDAFGNNYFIGQFSSPTISFGNITLSKNDTLANSIDGIIGKYDMNGKIIWVKKLANTTGVTGYSVASDSNGYIYVAGTFPSSTTFFGSNSLTGGGSFIAKYDTSGNVIWAKGINGNITTYYISTDHFNNLIISGLFVPPVTFGTITLSDPGNASGIFIAKMSQCNTAIPTITASGKTSFCQGGTVTLTSSVANNYLWSNSLTTRSCLVTGSGNYSVTTTDVNGCSTTSSGVYVYVSGLKKTSIGFTHDTLYVGDTYPPFVTYQWYLNSTIIPGAKGRIWIAQQNGAYNVNVIDSNGCAVMSYVYHLGNFGTESLSGNVNSILIYPNPNNGIFEIKTNSQMPVTKIELYDAVGNKLYDEKPNASSSQIHLENLSKGIYFLKLFTEDGVVVKRVVVE